MPNNAPTTTASIEKASITKPSIEKVSIEKASPITMDAVYSAPGYLFRRMQQIAVSIFVEECKAHDLTSASSCFT
jgi:hypothetical protein